MDTPPSASMQELDASVTKLLAAAADISMNPVPGRIALLFTRWSDRYASAGPPTVVSTNTLRALETWANTSTSGWARGASHSDCRLQFIRGAQVCAVLASPTPISPWALVPWKANELTPVVVRPAPSELSMALSSRGATVLLWTPRVSAT